MARALKRAWEPIWSQPAPAQRVIDDYLAGYRKRISIGVPKITLDTVEAAVKASRDSSTGPDGIPF